MKRIKHGGLNLVHYRVSVPTGLTLPLRLQNGLLMLLRMRPQHSDSPALAALEDGECRKITRVPHSTVY